MTVETPDLCHPQFSNGIDLGSWTHAYISWWVSFLSSSSLLLVLLLFQWGWFWVFFSCDYPCSSKKKATTHSITAFLSYLQMVHFLLQCIASNLSVHQQFDFYWFAWICKCLKEKKLNSINFLLEIHEKEFFYITTTFQVVE